MTQTTFQSLRWLMQAPILQAKASLLSLTAARQIMHSNGCSCVSFLLASFTLAFQRLAQGLSRFVSVLSSFMRKDLDSYIANDKGFQYVDGSSSALETRD